MAQFVLNLFIAFLWVLFSDEDQFYFSTFLKGYLIGLIIVYLLYQFFGGVFYLKKLWTLLKLFGVFGKELILSSLTTMKYILFHVDEMNPGLLKYQTHLTGNWQITILTMLIILTPGSVVLSISPDNKTLLIHSIHVDEDGKKALFHSIKLYEKLILEVMYT